MAATFVLAGSADCRDFAQTEMLADLLTRSLPQFSVRKIVKHPSEWLEWLEAENKKYGWTHSGSPLVYRVLGEGNPGAALLGDAPSLLKAPKFVGDHHAFAAMALNNYGLSLTVTDPETEQIVAANLEISKRPILAISTQAPSKTICISNAASVVAYQLLMRIGFGDLWGGAVPVHVRLLDSQSKQGILEGITMELEDFATENIKSVSRFSDAGEALTQVDAAVLFTGSTGANRIGKGYNGTRLSQDTIELLKESGKALSGCSVPVLLVGEGCNGGASLLARIAPSLTSCISTLTSVPKARASACLAQNLNKRVDYHDLKVSGADIHNIIVWGGDSNQPIVDLQAAVVSDYGGSVGVREVVKIEAALRDASITKDGESQRTLTGEYKPESFYGWIRDRTVLLAQNRGYAVDDDNDGPAMLIAKLIVDQLTLPMLDDGESPMHTAGILSDGNDYGIPEGIYFSFPVKSAGNGKFDIVNGLQLSDELKDLINEEVSRSIAQRDACINEAGLEPTDNIPRVTDTSSESLPVALDNDGSDETEESSVLDENAEKSADLAVGDEDIAADSEENSIAEPVIVEQTSTEANDGGDGPSP